MNMKRLILVAAGLALIVGSASFAIGLRVGTQKLEKSRLKEAGVFSVKMDEVLSATVRSLQAENKLVVFRYTADARVKAADVYAGLLRADQELIVPGSTVYFLDMAEFGPGNVRYDERSKVVDITLPALKIGDVALRPDKATAINHGWLTLSSGVVEPLAKRNFAAARRAFVAQANTPELVRLARAQALKSVAAQFEVPLRVVGRGDVKVSAHFG